jgi:replicative DNA helicase
MPEAEVHTRALAHESGVSLTKMDRRQLTPDDWTKVAQATQSLAVLPISVDDRSAVTVTDVRAHARTLHRRHPLSVVIVDYIQLLSAASEDRKRDRHVIVGSFSRALKQLAMEMGVPVIALSQLNRASTARADKAPSMEDLRESGSLEQDSDVVILLHATEDDPSTLHLHVPKNRHGIADARLTLIRRGHIARLDNAAWEPSRAAGA